MGHGIDRRDRRALARRAVGEAGRIGSPMAGGDHLGLRRPTSVSSHPPDVTSCRSVQVSSAVLTLKYRWSGVRHWSTTARISMSWSLQRPGATPLAGSGLDSQGSV